MEGCTPVSLGMITVEPLTLVSELLCLSDADHGGGGVDATLADPLVGLSPRVPVSERQHHPDRVDDLHKSKRLTIPTCTLLGGESYRQHRAGHAPCEAGTRTRDSCRWTPWRLWCHALDRRPRRSIPSQEVIGLAARRAARSAPADVARIRISQPAWLTLRRYTGSAGIVGRLSSSGHG